MVAIIAENETAEQPIPGIEVPIRHDGRLISWDFCRVDLVLEGGPLQISGQYLRGRRSNRKNNQHMYGKIKDHLTTELAAIEEAGLYKRERIITSEQGAEITVNGEQVLNFCANNYLGLSSNPEVVKAAHAALDSHGYGMSSVRFICGTQDIHKELERKLAQFHGTEDTILYAACFDANGGVFEPLLGQEDAIISDSLNHASIIDGVRLCKAMRYRYANNDMADLEVQLKMARADGANNIIIVTDGVFSMDGIIADLKGVCDLADKYDALVMVDDCHATGFIGKTGRGSIEHCGVMGRVDIITGTLGKALGGAMGGYTTGRKEIIDMLRQRSRPYLFSNSLTPVIVGASIKVIDLLSSSTELRDRLERNVDRFRTGIEKLGFETRGAGAAIVPVMLGDAKLSQVMADKLLEEGIYVIGFFFPVVPKDTARIRVQLSAAHSDAQIDKALAAFEKVGKELGVIG
jgi:glycine C-acetyltransferase